MPMRTPAQRGRLLVMAVALAIALALAGVMTESAQAQTYSVIYNFTGGADGATPMAGLTASGVDGFYGTANFGGNTGGPCGSSGCGVVYRVSNNGSGWALSPLYSFQGGTTDGQNPGTGSVVFGPDDGLYSTTYRGGAGCSTGPGCGTVFKLLPPLGPSQPTEWTETILHNFNGPNGIGPVGAPIFDHSGNIYGATNSGGLNNGGVIYQLSESNNWDEIVLAHPYGYPGSGVTMDHAGNLYGTTFDGGMHFFGSVYQLTPTGSGYTSTDLYDFTNGGDGAYPQAGVILDSQGNLYGSTTTGGSGRGGTVFKLTFSNGRYIYSTLYSFPSPVDGRVVSGPVGNLVMDSTGNLYGTTYSDGAHSAGAVFKLTPASGSWTYTSLHDFTNGSDGGFPYSNLVIDAQGNLYGTASQGGANGMGVVFEVTP